MLLGVSGLSKRFGGLQAVNQLHLDVASGHIVGLIGPNGAGKTTVFNLITGVMKPDAGRVIFDGKDITRKPPHRIAAMGIGRTFQLTTLFADFTAFDNVLASQYLNARSTFWHVLFNTRTYRRNESYAHEESNRILDLVGMGAMKDDYARDLPHGYQKMLGIALTLAVKPKLLMLDEPLGGLNADEIDFTLGIMKKLRRQGVSILIIEHNMQILDVCNHVVAINFGQNVCSGCAAEVRKDPFVLQCYLGEREQCS